MNAWLSQLYERDLNQLSKEVELFKQPENLWTTLDGVTNSAGNLCLHIIGNLNTYVGKNLGGTGYVRNREAEFSLKGVAASEIVASLAQTNQMTVQVIHNLPETAFRSIYPAQVFGTEMETGYFLIHLATHLNYHWVK